MTISPKFISSYISTQDHQSLLPAKTIFYTPPKKKVIIKKINKNLNIISFIPYNVKCQLAFREQRYIPF